MNFSRRIAAAKDRHFHDVQASRDHIRTLEERTGVSESAALARQDGVAPTDAANPEIAQADSHFAFKQDAERRQLRNIYFSVGDKTLRTQLIKAAFDSDDLIRQWRYREMQLIADYLDDLSGTSPWLRNGALFARTFAAVLAALLGILFVLPHVLPLDWLNLTLRKQVPSLIILALLFSGWDVWKSAKNRRRTVAAAEIDLNKAKLAIQECELWPQTFERGEMLSGDRFPQADALSARSGHQPQN